MGCHRGGGLRTVLDGGERAPPPGTAGSALALQTAVGFLLTGVTIVGVGLLEPGERGSWMIAFGILALGPLVGIIAMWRLRRLPEAVRMAGGRR